jgi:hypothetical protein
MLEYKYFLLSSPFLFFFFSLHTYLPAALGAHEYPLDLYLDGNYG